MTRLSPMTFFVISEAGHASAKRGVIAVILYNLALPPLGSRTSRPT
jgi:hypothetical protein